MHPAERLRHLRNKATHTFSYRYVDEFRLDDTQIITLGNDTSNYGAYTQILSSPYQTLPTGLSDAIDQWLLRYWS